MWSLYIQGRSFIKKCCTKKRNTEDPFIQGMLYENGIIMLFENGKVMIYE